MNVSKKAELIYEYEKQFAFDLAYKVISSPEIQIWMALFFFPLIVYLLQKKKVVEQRREFVENYMEEVKYALYKSLKINCQGLFCFDTMPDKAKKLHKKLINLRVRHYNKILKKMNNYNIINKNNVDAIIRLAYINFNSYIKFVNNINDCEEKLYEILNQYMNDDKNEIKKTIDKMKVWSVKLRNANIEKIFK